MNTSAEPIVSVLMPVHNAEPYIEQCLKSVLAQTLRNFEFIIVNDGSTDRTPEILERYTNDARIVLRHLPKSGVSKAMNYGLALARTPLIARMDADDVMRPERLERQVEFLSARPELGGCGSYYTLIDVQGNPIGDGRCPLVSARAIERHIAASGHVIFPHPTMMLRRDVVMGLGGYSEQYKVCEDVDLFVRMLAAGRPAVIQPEYLLYFRAHAHSTSAKNEALQFHLNHLIHDNYRVQKRGGRVRSVEEYFSMLASAPLPVRGLNWCRQRSFLLFRQAARARTCRKPLAATAMLVGAVTLNPRDAWWKAFRVLRRRIAPSFA